MDPPLISQQKKVTMGVVVVKSPRCGREEEGECLLEDGWAVG